MLATRRFCAVALGVTVVTGAAHGQNMLVNGNLDLVEDVEIVPGGFLPKPQGWQNIGFQTIAGPYEGEMSSEPWAGPSPTPVTTDGFMNPPQYNHAGDWAVFFRPFSGGAVTGPATGHLLQDVPGTAGTLYTLSGWAGGEVNVLMGGAEFALEFLDAGGGVLGGASVDLLPTLTLDNGLAFDYKEYSLAAVAPEGTITVRARVSMIDGMANPIGGGQAFVVDDFVLVPAAPTAAVLLLGGAVLGRGRRRGPAAAVTSTH